MAHGNAPLTPEGRRRLVERIIFDKRPISHVADEAGVSRQRLSVWVHRFELFGEEGLEDRSSRPARSPNITDEELADRIERIRRETKWGPDRISGHLALQGVKIAPATVHRVLKRRGLNRRRDIDPPTGEDMREVVRYEWSQPGDMLHIDVKKVGKIPDGGGWRVHGRDSLEALESRRKKNKRPGYTYLHAAVDDHTRLAYVECHNDERAPPHSTPDAEDEREGREVQPDHEGRMALREGLHLRGGPSVVAGAVPEAVVVVVVSHSSIGNRPPVSRAPEPGPRLTSEPIVAPLVDRPGQMALDLSGDNNVPGEHT